MTSRAPPVGPSRAFVDAMIDEEVDPNWPDPRIPVRPLKRTEYDRLIEDGIFTTGDHIELLRGFLIAKEPQGPDHSGTTEWLHRRLLLALDPRARVRSHSPILASDDSEPEPDIAVVPPQSAFKENPSTAHLVIEVSRSSLRVDRGVKAGIYAEASVPEYWVVSLPEGLVEVRDQPSGGMYRRLRTYVAGETITLVSFPDVSIGVSEIFAATY